MLSDGKVQSLQLHLQQDDNHFSSLPSKENCSSSSMMTTSSSPCSSFRSVYYGVASAGAVPFIWELQPGTPKYTCCEPDHDTITISTTTTPPPTTTTIPPSPPLTPPPSYFSTSNQKSKSNEKKSSSKKHKILNSIFPKMRINAAASSIHSQAHDVPLSSLSSSSSSSTTTRTKSSSSSSSSTTTRTKSSSSSSCSPTRTSTPLSFYLRSRFSSPRSSFDSRGDDGDVVFGSPTSTLCSASNMRAMGDEEICNNDLLFRGCYSMVNMKKALLSIVGTSSHGSSAQPSPTVAA